MKSVEQTVSKSTLILFISAVMAAILLISMLLIGTQTVAWFKSYTVVTHPAEFSNFVTSVEYSLDGDSWTAVNADKPIPLTIDTVDDIQIRVSYKSAHHTAYLRVSVFGGFYNRNTKTYLPLSENAWSFTTTGLTKWSSLNGYLYYKELLNTPDGTDILQLETFRLNATLPQNISSHQAYNGELYVIVDAVQPNRYQELWGITKLPWE